MELATTEIEHLKADVHGRALNVLRGIEAKFYLAKDELDKAAKAIKGDRSPAVFSLRAKIEMRRASIHKQNGYIKLAEQSMTTAKAHVAEGLQRYPNNEELLKLQSQFESEA